MDGTGDVPENSSKDMESVRYSNESLSREGSLSVFQDQADFAEIPTPSEGSVITPDASMMNFFQFDDTYTSDLDNRELIVRVDNPEKHSGALDSYVTFRITTNTTRSDFDAHEFVVRRRYKDFLWLKQQLERAHPGCILPALPEKSALQQRFSQEFLGGRVVGLHRFLNRLAEHPSLSTDPSLKLFLTAKPHVSHCGSIRQFLPGAKIMWINIIYFELHFLSFLFITHTLVIYILLVFFTRQNVAGGSPLNYARCHLKSRRKKSLSTGGAFLAATDRS